MHTEPLLQRTEDPPSREDLLRLVATGDKRAFADLYDQVSPRVLGIIRRVLIDFSQTEEVAQDVFVEVWQNASRFEHGKGSALTWILTMAHRRAIDRVRASQASRDRDVRVGIRDLDVAFDPVAEATEITVEYARVTAAMAKLTELQRQSVTLAYHGGYSQRDLAEMLGVPLGTIKTRLRDGLMNLRKEMAAA